MDQLQHPVPLQAASLLPAPSGLHVYHELLIGAASRQEAGTDVAADEGVEHEGAVFSIMLLLN